MSNLICCGSRLSRNCPLSSGNEVVIFWPDWDQLSIKCTVGTKCVKKACKILGFKIYKLSTGTERKFVALVYVTSQLGSNVFPKIQIRIRNPNFKSLGSGSWRAVEFWFESSCTALARSSAAVVVLLSTSQLGICPRILFTVEKSGIYYIYCTVYSIWSVLCKWRAFIIYIYIYIHSCAL